MSRAQGTFVAALVAILAVACSSPPPPPPGLLVALATNPPAGELTPSAASVPVGIAMELSVTPQGYVNDVSVSLHMDDPTIAYVVPMTTPEQFVVVGLAPGNTRLHFLVNGEETTSVTVTDLTTNTPLAVAVTPQSPPQ